MAVARHNLFFTINFASYFLLLSLPRRSHLTPRGDVFPLTFAALCYFLLVLACPLPLCVTKAVMPSAVPRVADECGFRRIEMKNGPG